MKPLCSRGIFVVNLTSLRMSWNAAFLSGESTKKEYKAEVYIEFSTCVVDLLHVAVSAAFHWCIIHCVRACVLCKFCVIRKKYDLFYEPAYMPEY